MAATVRIARVVAASTAVAGSLAHATSAGNRGSAVIRVAAVSAVSQQSQAVVRIADVSATTGTGASSSATVRVADAVAYAPQASLVWNGASWQAITPDGQSTAAARSQGSIGISVAVSAASTARVRSVGGGALHLSGTLALTGGGALTVSGGTGGATSKFGSLTLTAGGTLTLVGSALQGPPGAGSVTVVPDPLNDPPRVLLDLTGFLGTTATITRIDAAGNRSPVRLGSPATLDAGTWVGYDYEAPYGQAVRYEVAATLTVTSDPITLDVAAAWLVHPGIPDLSAAIHVSGRGDRTHAANQGVFKVIGRAAPLTRSDGVRSSPAYDLTLGTQTVDERSALGALLGDCTTLLLQIPADDVYQWVSIGDVAESDVVPVFESKVQHWTLPCTVTDGPEGLLQAQRTLADLAAEFSTLLDIADNYATLRDVAVDNLIGS